MNFSGSYLQADATFLLDPVPVAENNGVSTIAAHCAPGAEYVRHFLGAVERNANLVAADVAAVAHQLNDSHEGEIVLVSLVCAGTPAAVLIHRALKMLGRKTSHYAISSVRGRGLDFNALNFILERHRASEVVFVDGWTGKGFIAGELKESVELYNKQHEQSLSPALTVLADLGGVAGTTGSFADYLIPSAMLRATLNGLTGPSMVNPRGAGHFDACLYFDMLENQDWSRRFVEMMMPAIGSALCLPTRPNNVSASEIRLRSQALVTDLVKSHGLSSHTWVKPGVCEATRALLTREVAMTLIVRDLQDPDVQHLLLLASRKICNVETDRNHAYGASVLLRA